MEIIKNNTRTNNLLKKINPTFGSIYGLPSISLKNFIKTDKKINKSICIIDLKNKNFFTDSVKGELNYYCHIFGIKDKSFKKTIEYQLDLFGMSNSILDKTISELSNSEKNMLLILVNFLFDYEMYVISGIFDWADRNNQKRIKSVLSILKKNKKIIIIDNDINGLYELCDILVYSNNEKELLFISKKDMPDHLKSLILAKQPVPDMLYLTYIAKNNKKVKLTYYSDVRDVIKDIYKHV